MAGVSIKLLNKKCAHMMIYDEYIDIFQLIAVICCVVYYFIAMF